MRKCTCGVMEQRSQKSNIIFSMSGVVSSGISTLLKDNECFPSSAHRARRRMESLSPKLTLSSSDAEGISGRETPINSADSRRVDTEDLRRWCELRLEGGAVCCPALDKDEEALVEVLGVDAPESDSDPKEKDERSLRPDDLEEEREAATEEEEDMEAVRE